MLVKVSVKKVAPPKHILERTRQLLESNNNSGKTMFSNPKRDNFWAKRYLLFDKFDLGIKLDEESWFLAIPEVIAEHISLRIKCATVLDGYCGVGCASLKFADTCHTVLADENEHIKLECLEANEVVYGVENITNLNFDFLELPEIKADVVFLAPQCLREFAELDEVDPIEHYSPPLGIVFEKALSINNNIVLLLPATIGIHKVAALMA
mgnify:CR=1 FL=1